MSIFIRVSSLLLLAAISVCLSSCTETVAPSNEFEDPLSVFGLLTPDRDTQFVWVHPIEELPTLGTPDALEDVTVMSTDLKTGEVRMWRDTVLQRANGQYEYLYQAAFRPGFDGRYRVEVHHEEGIASADIRIPPEVDVSLIKSSRDTVLVEVSGGDFQILNPQAEYKVRSGSQSFMGPVSLYRRGYWGKEQQIRDGYRISVTFNVDRFNVDAEYAAEHGVATALYCPHVPSLLLGELRLHAIVGDTAWRPPGPEFDPYILSQPGTMENVTNGTGFIGGGYRIEQLLDVPKEVVEAACFFYCTSSWVCDTSSRL